MRICVQPRRCQLSALLCSRMRRLHKQRVVSVNAENALALSLSLSLSIILSASAQHTLHCAALLCTAIALRCASERTTLLDLDSEIHLLSTQTTTETATETETETAT